MSLVAQQRLKSAKIHLAPLRLLIYSERCLAVSFPVFMGSVGSVRAYARRRIATEPVDRSQFAFTDRPKPLPARKKKKEVRFNEKITTPREVPKSLEKGQQTYELRGLDEAAIKLKKAEELKDLTSRQHAEKRVLEKLKYKNPDLENDYLVWDDNTFFNFRRPDNTYRPLNPYSIYLDWEAKMQEIEKTDTRDPHKRFFDQLKEWELRRKVARMKKAGFKFPEGKDPLRYFDPDYEEIGVPPEVLYSKPPFKEYIVPANTSLSEVNPLHEQPKTPVLEHGLDRTLFSPGVHVLRDERTNVYNFPPQLENIISTRDFDFSNVPALVQSSQDKDLAKLAAKEGKIFTASASSLSAALTQFHFLLSRNRQPHPQNLSYFYKNKKVHFETSSTKATSFFLVWDPDNKVYALDTDKSQDGDTLSLLDQVLKAKLTTPSEEFQRFSKQRQEAEDRVRPNSAYHYSTCGDIMIRSHSGCHDSRLPGTGLFGVKPRAVCAVRDDMEYAEIHNGSDYQLNQLVGSYESYEREKVDFMTSTLFESSLQARIGRQDGIFVAYHNIRKIFGFEYLSLEEMDQIFHTRGFKGVKDGDMSFASFVADEEFRISMDMLSGALNRVIKKFPEQSVNIVFKAPTTSEEAEATGNMMVVLVNPMPDAIIQNIQDGIVIPKPTAEEYARLEKEVQNETSKEVRRGKRFTKDRLFLDKHTLIQGYQSRRGLMSYRGCSGFRLGVESFINDEKLDPQENPTPLPGQKWTVGLTVKEIDFANFGQYLDTVCYSISNRRSHLPRGWEEDDYEFDKEETNKQLASRPDTIKRTQEEITDMVTKLGSLPKPTPHQLLLRQLGEKGAKSELDRQTENGAKDPHVWTSGSVFKVAAGEK